jgi:hypothetical protein
MGEHILMHVQNKQTNWRLGGGELGTLSLQVVPEAYGEAPKMQNKAAEFAVD